MLTWDIFCAVIDNYGDIGTCWRLARQLVTEHAVHVRLWVDRLDSFAHLCPDIDINSPVQWMENIEVRRWSPDFPSVDIADVVIEAFACEIPPDYASAMAKVDVPPVWINLEYLSAEAWVEECHLLPSHYPSYALTKFFFFPGFTPGTGGLLREQGLLSRRAAFDSAACDEFWNLVGIPARSTMLDEIRLSLFCYHNPVLSDLLDCWSRGPVPIRALVTPGAATEQVHEWVGTSVAVGEPFERGALTLHELPFLSQPLYDQLLWACDLNFVRGEDSFVRAQWARNPFVWQIYPQAEQSHRHKLDSFLGRYLKTFPGRDDVLPFWMAWNGFQDLAGTWERFLAQRLALKQHGQAWAEYLDQAKDLANNLVDFVEAKRRPRRQEHVGDTH